VLSGGNGIWRGKKRPDQSEGQMAEVWNCITQRMERAQRGEGTDMANGKVGIGESRFPQLQRGIFSHKHLTLGIEHLSLLIDKNRRWQMATRASPKNSGEDR